MKNILLTMLLLVLCPCTMALVYPLPSFQDNVVGQIKVVHAQSGDNLYKISRRNEMGFEEMLRANPKIARSKILSINTALVVPAFFILPDMPHQDVIVNLPELRLYYYPLHQHLVITEPVSVGRPKWETPQMESKIVEKIKDPYWVVPKSIQEYSARKGIFLPTIVPPGHNNPLGQFALRLDKWSVLIHGTNQPFHIGKRISSGCIRMYPEDIAHIFHKIEKHTPVYIINQPYKLGWLHHRLYLEVHNPLKEYAISPVEEQQEIQQLILKASANHKVQIDWKAVNIAIKGHSGIPIAIGEEG